MNSWSELIYEKMSRHAKENAEDWSKVKDFIKGCLADGGIPMFKDKYAGKRFEIDGKPAVLAICYAGRGFYPDHQWFKDVPEKDIDLIESKTGEWRDFLGRDMRSKKLPLNFSSLTKEDIEALSEILREESE